jgi:glucan biosynthesis protein C
MKREMDISVAAPPDGSGTKKTRGSCYGEKGGKPRLPFLDNLKVLLTAMVVLHHAAITYGAPGGWYYNEIDTGQLDVPSLLVFVVFVAVNQAYFMGLFYLISGFFTPGSADRKGAAAFVKDRLLRLGVPIIMYAFLLAPVLRYGLSAAAEKPLPTFAELPAFFIREGLRWEIGPLWYAEWLFFFSVVYLLGRWVAQRRDGKTRAAPGFPGHRAILALAVVVGAVNFIVRLGFPIGSEIQPLNMQLSFLFQYICLFAAGAAAYRGNWLSRISAEAGKAWTRAAAILILCLPLLFLASIGLDGDISSALGSWHWQAFVYALWEQITGMAVIVSLLVFFRDRMNRTGAIWKILSAHAYAVYVLHPLILVFLALWMRDMTLPPLMKFLIVGPAALVLCFLAALAVRRLPLMKAVL